jgi:hypothetical protein
VSAYSVQRLGWTDPAIETLDLPGGAMTLRSGFGSGLAVRPGDRPGLVWAVGDRGPNIKVRDAIERYGLDHLWPLADVSGAKIMPHLETGPALAELRVGEDAVKLVRVLPLTRADGRLLSGLPNPGSDQLMSEPVFDLAGAPISPDPDGLDTEGLVALADGSFWVGDEFGPSLVHVDARGRVMRRLLPLPRDAAESAVGLPAIAAKRQLNRGFEALAISADERALFLAFQSPLAHPDQAAHRAARHVRVWRLDPASGAVVAQYAYPLDPPESFLRDCAAGPFGRDDIKVSELLWLADDMLLVLERGSKTTKIYRCVLTAGKALPRAYLDPATRPTLEERSASEAVDFPELSKELLFSSDDHPEVSSDLEGAALLSPCELILVSDNDFGVEGAETCFWRVRFEEALCGG